MLSRTPWKQIRQAPSKGFGSEQIPRYRIKRLIPNVVIVGAALFGFAFRQLRAATEASWSRAALHQIARD
jgi:hypothetical protein